MNQKPQNTDHVSQTISPACVFVGALDDEVNILSLTWFCRRVWPEIEKRLPHATFTMVGSNPDSTVWDLTDSVGVSLAANVVDEHPYLAAADLVVVPLRVTRCIPYGILDVLAQGKAVLATPAALDGLPLLPGIHVHVAATTDEWIAAAAHLLENPQLCAAIGSAGRAHVEQLQGWKLQMQRYAHLSIFAAEPHRFQQLSARLLPPAGALP